MERDVFLFFLYVRLFCLEIYIFFYSLLLLPVCCKNHDAVEFHRETPDAHHHQVNVCAPRVIAGFSIRGI